MGPAFSSALVLPRALPSNGSSALTWYWKPPTFAEGAPSAALLIDADGCTFAFRNVACGGFASEKAAACAIVSSHI